MSIDPRKLRIANYTYDLPEVKIAREPLPLRDSAKMLIYRNGALSDGLFADLPAHLAPGTLVVANKTAVVPARLLFQKGSGGWIEVFCLEPGPRYADMQTAMAQQGEVYWQCMVGGASKWKHGMTLSLESDAPHFTLEATIADRKADAFIIRFCWNNASLTFAEVLDAAGKIPLPPYLKREAHATDKERYQTVFAADKGSVAAPTAALHFTPSLIGNLTAKDIALAYITLHVGAGTFKPVKSETMEGHPMHAETIEVGRDFLLRVRAALATGLVAVGTTSLRTLESLYHLGCKAAAGKEWNPGEIAITQWEVYEKTYALLPGEDAFNALISWMDNRRLTRLVARTQILITPGYVFRTARGLITNFHQPSSTLLLLIAAWLGEDWRNVYAHALEHDYRFLSYGDGSLLWRA